MSKYFKRLTKREKEWQQWGRQVQRIVAYKNYLMAAKAEDESTGGETTEKSQTAQKSTESPSYAKLTDKTKGLIKNVLVFLPTDTSLEDFSPKNIKKLSSSILAHMIALPELANRNKEQLLNGFALAVDELEKHMKLIEGIKRNREYLRAALKHRADAARYQKLIESGVMTRHAIGVGQGETYEFSDLNKNTQEFIKQIGDSAVLPPGTKNEDFDDDAIDKFLDRVPADNYDELLRIIHEIEHKKAQSEAWSKRTSLLSQMHNGANFIARIPLIHALAIPFALLFSVAGQYTWAQAIKTNPTLGRKEVDEKRKYEIGASISSAIMVAGTVAAFLFPPIAPIALAVAAFGFLGNTLFAARLAKSDLDIEKRRGGIDTASYKSRIKSKNGEIGSALGAVVMGLSAFVAATIAAAGAAALLTTPVGWAIVGIGTLATIFSIASFVYAKIMSRKADVEEEQFLEQQSKGIKSESGISTVELAKVFRQDAKAKLAETTKQLEGLSDVYKEATAKPQVRERSSANVEGRGPLTFEPTKTEPRPNGQKIEKQETVAPAPQPQKKPDKTGTPDPAKPKV